MVCVRINLLSLVSFTCRCLIISFVPVYCCSLGVQEKIRKMKKDDGKKTLSTTSRLRQEKNCNWNSKNCPRFQCDTKKRQRRYIYTTEFCWKAVAEVPRCHRTKQRRQNRSASIAKYIWVKNQSNIFQSRNTNVPSVPCFEFQFLGVVSTYHQTDTSGAGIRIPMAMRRLRLFCDIIMSPYSHIP